MARFLKIFLTLLSITAIGIGLYYYFNNPSSSSNDEKAYYKKKI